jgi:hypothetical protein
MIMFPTPLMSTIGELGEFLSREKAATGSALPPAPIVPAPLVVEPEDATGAPKANGEARPHARAPRESRN